MSTHHHHSHEFLTLASLREAASVNAADRLAFAETEDAYEAAWGAFTEAKNQIAGVAQNRLMSIVLTHLPEAHFVVLYEDRSHDAPHGHIEGIYDVEGHELVQGTTDQWHDLEWSSEADEFVWDIYHVASSHFADLEGRRRLVIGKH